MSETVEVTRDTLRNAINDPRYLNSNHPEAQAFRQWVSEGFRALYPEDGTTHGIVHVRSYIRNGHQVSAYSRRGPAGGEATNGTAVQFADRPGPHADAERRARCDAQAAADEARCRRLRPTARVARALCWASVNLRFGACMAGRELPRLSLPE